MGEATVSPIERAVSKKQEKKAGHRAPLLEAFPGLADSLPGGVVHQVNAIDNNFNGKVDPGAAYNMYCMIYQGLNMKGPPPVGFDYEAVRKHYSI